MHGDGSVSTPHPSAFAGLRFEPMGIRATFDLNRLSHAIHRLGSHCFPWMTNAQAAVGSVRCRTDGAPQRS